MTDTPKHDSSIECGDSGEQPVWTTPRLDVLPLSMTRNLATNPPTDVAIVPNFS